MGRKDPMVHVRIPPKLKEELRKAAEENRRSVNAEIVIRLEESIKDKKR
jgi:hypothetical protein